MYEEFGKGQWTNSQTAAQSVLSWQVKVLTRTGHVVGQRKERFVGVLNPANTCSWQEAKSEDLGEDSFI